MGIIEEEAFATFVRYYQDLGKININEPAEEGSVVEQIQYFIQFLISKPEIKLILEIGFNSGSSPELNLTVNLSKTPLISFLWPSGPSFSHLLRACELIAVKV